MATERQENRERDDERQELNTVRIAATDLRITYQNEWKPDSTFFWNTDLEKTLSLTTFWKSQESQGYKSMLQNKCLSSYVLFSPKHTSLLQLLATEN